MKKEYTIGELVSTSGLTIRTLQHYDNIGLLPASGRRETGRRYYTEEDIIKLEQIIFYKSLGFSLSEIQEKLVNTSELKDMERILSYQANVLYIQMEEMHTSLAAIEACKEVIGENKVPPWSFLASFISKLNSTDFVGWDSINFSEEENKRFQAHFTNIDEALAFLHTWKALTIKAAIYQEAKISTTDKLAQELAKEWLKMEEAATGGDENLRGIYIKVDNERDVWPEGPRKLMEAADEYLNACVKYYCDLNAIQVPW